jgi:hypothetical protein
MCGAIQAPNDWAGASYRSGLIFFCHAFRSNAARFQSLPSTVVLLQIAAYKLATSLGDKVAIFIQSTLLARRCGKHGTVPRENASIGAKRRD